ncbi:MAG: hypothetical protein V1894_06445 [Chloroflexota bacterium]
MTEASHLQQVLLNTGDEEPPGTDAAKNGDKPPQLVTSTTRQRFFSQVPDEDWNDWRWQFRNRIQDIEELTQFIPLSEEEKSRLKLVIRKYPMSITPYYLSLINSADPNDPIRKQSVPSFEEVGFVGKGREDPLEEKRDSVVPGLVHRYPDRVLMVLTDLCPMFCRHCTRKREWEGGVWVRTWMM